MESHNDLIAEQFRGAAGLDPDVPTHVDQDDPANIQIATEPEGGYGGADGDPDTNGVDGGRPAFQAERISDDLDDSDQADVVMAAGPVGGDYGDEPGAQTEDLDGNVVPDGSDSSEVTLTDEEKDGLDEDEQAELLALKRDEAEGSDS